MRQDAIAEALREIQNLPWVGHEGAVPFDLAQVGLDLWNRRPAGPANRGCAGPHSAPAWTAAGALRREQPPEAEEAGADGRTLTNELPARKAHAFGPQDDSRPAQLGATYHFQLDHKRRCELLHGPAGRASAHHGRQNGPAVD